MKNNEKAKKPAFECKNDYFRGNEKNIFDGSKDQRTINAFFTFTEWIFMKDPP